MAVKIRLKRMGKIRSPFYRVVVMDSRTKRDGRAIEEIGIYHPTREPSVIEIDSGRAQYWLGVGAKPTEQVEALMKITGDWQRFKGEPGAEGTLKVAPAKPGKKELYEAALAAAGKADDEYAKQPAPSKRPAKEQARAADAPAVPEVAVPGEAIADEAVAAEVAAEAVEPAQVAEPVEPAEPVEEPKAEG